MEQVPAVTAAPADRETPVGVVNRAAPEEGTDRAPEAPAAAAEGKPQDGLPESGFFVSVAAQAPHRLILGHVRWKQGNKHEKRIIPLRGSMWEGIISVQHSIDMVHFFVVLFIVIRIQFLHALGTDPMAELGGRVRLDV